MRRMVRRVLIEATRLRRFQRGSLRENWPLEVEARTRALHHYARRLNWVPLSFQRHALRALTPRRPPRKVDLQPVDVNGIRGEWLIPKGVDDGRVLLYLHGGGYALGSIDTHRHFVAQVAHASGMRTLLVDYRLAPEHPFPAALEDACDVWQWLLAHGVDPKRAAIAGESAGGGLTMATLLATRDAGKPLPATAAVLSPWVDLTLSGESIETNDRFDFVPRHILALYANRYACDNVRTHPLISPAHAALHDLPPLLIQAGEAETLVDDARLLHTRAVEAGVEADLSVYPDMIHAFMIMRFPPAREAITELAQHLRRHTAST